MRRATKQHSRIYFHEMSINFKQIYIENAKINRRSVSLLYFDGLIPLTHSALQWSRLLMLISSCAAFLSIASTFHFYIAINFVGIVFWSECANERANDFGINKLVKPHESFAILKSIRLSSICRTLLGLQPSQLISPNIWTEPTKGIVDGRTPGEVIGRRLLRKCLHSDKVFPSIFRAPKTTWLTSGKETTHGVYQLSTSFICFRRRLSGANFRSPGDTLITFLYFSSNGGIALPTVSNDNKSNSNK